MQKNCYLGQFLMKKWNIYQDIVEGYSWEHIYCRFKELNANLYKKFPCYMVVTYKCVSSEPKKLFIERVKSIVAI